MSDESPEAQAPASKAAKAAAEEPATVVLRVSGPVGVTSFVLPGAGEDGQDLVLDQSGTEVDAKSAEDIINAAARSGVYIEVSE